MATPDINKGEKKIMDNNPAVARVNLVNDLIGGEEGSKSLGYKVLVAVLVTLMLLIGVFMYVFGKFIAGSVFIVVAVILFFTTTGLKFKSKKYKVDKKIVDKVEPLFKD